MKKVSDEVSRNYNDVLILQPFKEHLISRSNFSLSRSSRRHMVQDSCKLCTRRCFVRASCTFRNDWRETAIGCSYNTMLCMQIEKRYKVSMDKGVVLYLGRRKLSFIYSKKMINTDLINNWSFQAGIEYSVQVLDIEIRDTDAFRKTNLFNLQKLTPDVLEILLKVRRYVNQKHIHVVDLQSP